MVVNKRAGFDYLLLEKLEAGIALLGGEVKSVRNNNIDLSRSFVKEIGNELYLVNANIPIEGKKDYNPTRSRKLLIRREQITSLQAETKAKNLIIVPTKVYTKGRLVKVEIALAKSKRKFEKKEAIKRKDIEREIDREYKDSV